MSWAEQRSCMRHTAQAAPLQYPVLIRGLPGAAYVYLKSVEVQNPVEMWMMILENSIFTVNCLIQGIYWNIPFQSRSQRSISQTDTSSTNVSLHRRGIWI